MIEKPLVSIVSKGTITENPHLFYSKDGAINFGTDESQVLVKIKEIN